MEININMKLDNDAFIVLDIEDESTLNDTANGSEIAIILRFLADRVDCSAIECGDSFTARDTNGNKCLIATVEG